jgi:hypothetical protein
MPIRPRNISYVTLAATLIVATLMGCSAPDVHEGDSLLHGDSVPQLTMTRVERGYEVYWLASMTNVSMGDIRILSVNPLSVPTGLMLESPVFLSKSDYFVPTLGWAGTREAANNPVIWRPNRPAKGVVVPAGGDSPGWFYLHFRVTGSMEVPVRVNDVVWDYEQDGVRFREISRQALVLTRGTERPD